MTTKQKQWQLWVLGYYTGTIDGLWGKLSVEATQALQQDYGLDGDGIFGAKTAALSMDIISKLQKALTDGTMAIDGLAGMETSTAVADWQRSHGQTVTGVADVTTLNLILAVAADKNPTSENWWENIRYFSRSEFKCKCGGAYCDGFPAEPEQLLIEQADQVREHFGAPAVVTSGVRCEVHNANVGGVAGSRHKLGKAMDFRIEGKPAATVLAYVKMLPGIRYCYAIDGSHVHMDVE